MVYVSIMSLRKQNSSQKKLLAAGIRAAFSGARRGPPARARRAPTQPRRKLVGDKIHRASIQRPSGLSAKHHFNAFGPQVPQALAFSIGPATQVCGAKRFTITAGSTTEGGAGIGNQYTLVGFQPGLGREQARWCIQNGPDNPTTPNVWHSGYHATISSSGIDSALVPTDSNPSQIMCSRGSIRIRNLTPAGLVGGAVHFMRASQGLDDIRQSLQGPPENIKDLVLGSKDTVTMSGSQLTQTHQWDCIPVSQDKYHAFATPSATYPWIDPGISTVIILIEHSVEAQTFEFTMAATYYARYNKVGPLANAASAPPTAPLPTINRVREGAEMLGSLGKPLLMAGMNALKDEYGPAIPGMLGNLMRSNVGFPRLMNASRAVPMLTLG